MASLRRMKYSEQFLCSICLEMFTDPVSTPCGHNFCKTCIDHYWDSSGPCRCPLCNKKFDTRPELNVNTFILEMVSQFKLEAKSASMKQRIHQSDVFSPRKVLCDMCPEPRLKALKSCMVCLLSYCQLHLEPHGRVSRLKRHQLIEPVENLEKRMCPRHNKPLELFCTSEGVCVCLLCSVLEHKSHHMVPLKEQYEEQWDALQHTQVQTQHMMEQRRLKIQNIRHSLELSDTQAQTHMEQGLLVYSSLMDSVQSSMELFKHELQQMKRRSQEQAEVWITELEIEICQLEKRSSDMEKLTCFEDHIHFLQRVTSLKTTADMKDWTQVGLEMLSFEESVDRAVEQLQITLNEQLNKLSEKVKLWKLQQWAVDVTLDPDTAHPRLVLSEDLKQVHDGDVKRSLRDNPERFSDAIASLGRQSFSSGRFYFEVQVKGKTAWDLGIVKESINRKKSYIYSPQNGFWSLILRDGDKYTACGNPSVNLSLKSVPERISVFVDYEQGLVSYYDGDTAAHIFSFTGCTFNEKIYPYFSPCDNDQGKNSASLIVMSVSK